MPSEYSKSVSVGRNESVIKFVSALMAYRLDVTLNIAATTVVML